MSTNYQSVTKTVNDIVHLYRNAQLNLEPAFQRDSVWNLKDRQGLIDSMLRGYPLPAVFLYQRHDDGFLVYDVIDGKQRLESILRFAGEMKGAGNGRFDAKVTLPGRDEDEDVDWNRLKKLQLGHLMTGYKLQVIEVSGELADIINLFVRINSTGKALSSQERRSAKYYQSAFLTEAAKLAEALSKALVKNRILSKTQLARRKHVELVCELMLSAHNQDVINKKSALDKVMGSDGITAKQVKQAVRVTRAAINRLWKLLPKIRESRFAKLADFYSLVVLLQRFEREGLALANKRHLRLAGEMLQIFGIGVDALQHKTSKLEGASPADALFRDYLLTVKEGTDAISNRRARERILESLIRPLFEKKDSKRTFTPEQRRILWNTSAARKCVKCKKELTWDDFEADHVVAHSKGGKTDLKNAALLCKKDNAKKGNR